MHVDMDLESTVGGVFSNTIERAPERVSSEFSFHLQRMSKEIPVRDVFVVSAGIQHCWLAVIFLFGVNKKKDTLKP